MTGTTSGTEVTLNRADEVQEVIRTLLDEYT
jgi:hypothetical protein